MPFFWFGGGSSSSSTAKSSVTISSQHNHARKLSQSLSASSGKKNAARLAEVRSEATASYLQHQSEEEHQQNHRRTQSADISRSRRSRTSTGSGHGKRGGVIAIEDDDDSRHKCRIDQGLIDACNEAKVPETKASWWTSFSVTAITPPSSPSLLLGETNANETASKPAPNINGTPLKHRRTVSKTTYRV